MVKGSQFIRALAAFTFLIFGLVLVACGGMEPATADLTAVATPEAPAGVLKARDSVLEFLRDGANECVPPKQAAWTLDDLPNPPAGYEVYRFLSGGCAMTITVAAEPVEATVYHVALGDGATGFCWQAVVDDSGKILMTGLEAQTDPTLGNPAKNYCEQNGYTFELVTRASGQVCGMCVFEEGRACNAWAYFHGACTPENAPTAEP